MVNASKGALPRQEQLALQAIEYLLSKAHHRLPLGFQGKNLLSCRHFKEEETEAQEVTVTQPVGGEARARVLPKRPMFSSFPLRNNSLWLGVLASVHHPREVAEFPEMQTSLFAKYK